MLLSFNKQFVPPILDGRKCTTIREDLPKRWREGLTIHFCTDMRRKGQNTFAIGKVRSVQQVVVDFEAKEVFINSYSLVPSAVDTFIRGEGFDTAEAFWEWFRLAHAASANQMERYYVGRLIMWYDCFERTKTWEKSGHNVAIIGTNNQ
jgi:hypothetical protein